ncbi:Hypothetical protein GbCGDNIH9_8443 [Granulibacter bethesdensis]|uniref:Uncharacterized protein n=1 Tax=Granulibacter bethesdensis TaxID=364410 RepID=A0AAC9K6X4_9PROT|nr:Hypothetical protein GbCGDNIH9_8443 [Granulibacter bethesdensis]APH61530.1 Hypothetical protein GbCGDNIH8_8443 [Granulibacter bethesdensis]
MLGNPNGGKHKKNPETGETDCVTNRHEAADLQPLTNSHAIFALKQVAPGHDPEIQHSDIS